MALRNDQTSRRSAQKRASRPAADWREPITRENFWDVKDNLSKIRKAAEARSTGSWAVLANTLVRVSSLIPQNVVLPAVVGEKAALNYFAVVAGPSSAGKSVTQGVSRALVPKSAKKIHLSTGQGIVHHYVEPVKPAQGTKGTPAKPGSPAKPPKPGHPFYMHRTNASGLAYVDEVGTLSAVAGKEGSTLLSTLRTLWNGESAGSSTATAENRTSIEEHSFRISVLVGSQVGAAGFLLNDSDAGTPQRFIFVPALDSGIAPLTEEEIERREAAFAGKIARMTEADYYSGTNVVIQPLEMSGIPSWPMSLKPAEEEFPFGYTTDDDDEDQGDEQASREIPWLVRARTLAPETFHEVSVCLQARMTVMNDRERVKEGLPPEYPAHHLLNRLKTASLLSFLCGENGDVTDDYWDLAGVLMEVSEETKAHLRCYAEQEEAAEDDKKGKSLARIDNARKASADDLAAIAIEKNRESILNRLKKVGGSELVSVLRNNVHRPYKPYFDPALDSLCEDGLVVPTEDGKRAVLVDTSDVPAFVKDAA